MDAKGLRWLRKVFRKRRVLITGDTGFKGSWLCLALEEMGAEVWGMALPPGYANSHFELLGLRNTVKHQDVDVREAGAVERAFKRANPEIVFHLAAQPIVRRSYEAPKETFDTNIGGAVNLLECVRKSAGVRSLVFVTSDKCYRNKEWVWSYRENDELGGSDPYSGSKAAAEVVFRSYWDSYFSKRRGPGAASARAGNVIGGGDWAPDRIVPDCFRRLMANRPIELRNPDATRPWQHVLEPVFGYVFLAAKLFEDPQRYHGAWNFGPMSGSVRTVMDVAQAIVDDWGKGVIKVSRSNQNIHEARLLQLNSEKARTLLGWHSVWEFDECISRTVEWYRCFSEKRSIGGISRRQMRQYIRDYYD